MEWQYKTSENITFTIHYADGTSVDVKDGVLFTVNDNNTMDLHVGVSKLWQLFGVYLCFMEFLTVNNLIEIFGEYVENFMKQYDEGGGHDEKHAAGSKQSSV